MRVLIFVAGLVLGALLAGTPAVAQSYPWRSLAARFNGAPIPLTATTDGYLYIVIN